MTIKKSNIHICSECLGEFEPKNIFIAPEPKKKEYSTLYCVDCLKKLKIDTSEPYLKPRKKREPKEPQPTTKF